MTICNNSLPSKLHQSQNQLNLPPSIAYKSRNTILGAEEPNENASSLQHHKTAIDSPNVISSSTTTRPKCSNSRFNRTLSERKIFTQTADKLVLVMVGLPARGKSFIAKKLCKFLCWKGLGCRIFNVGQLRRSVCTDNQDHTFFDPHNEKAILARENLAQQSLQLAQKWLLGANECKGGDVAIFDATNTTKRRRQMLLKEFDQFAMSNDLSVHVVFIESICTNEAVIDANMTEKVLSSPDYARMNVEDAIQDLKQRMKNYEAAYQAIEEEENLSYIKLFDLQSKVHANNMYVLFRSEDRVIDISRCRYGHVAKSILPYMMSFHIEHRPIWLVRAGHCREVQSDFHSIAKHPCVATRSANLSALGVAFAEKLADFVEERTQAVMAPTATCAVCQRTRHANPDMESKYTEPCLVMTSTLPRAVETAQFLSHERYEQLATLNPLDKGECYGLSMSEMQDQMPVR